MHEYLNSLTCSNTFDKLEIILTTLYLLYSLVDKKSKDKSHRIWENSHNCICLIVYSEFFSLIEQFIRFKDNIFTFKNSKSEDNRNYHTYSKETVAKPFLCSVNNEQRSSKDSQENIYFHYPEPLKTNFTV